VRRRAGLTIEEGGWGKGAALKDALAALEGAGRHRGERALLDLGGQVAVWSASEAGSSWTVDVADPRRRGRPVIALRVDHGSISTSGDSERAVEVNGRRYGHLLDPQTGRPAPDFGSVTVWTADPLLADCLSTGLFVMGPERALAWTAAHPGVEVLVLSERDPSGRIAARASRGLRRRLAVLTEDVTLEGEGPAAAVGRRSG
jgi:thiamine biosynthesis lipoprotein